MRSKRAPQVIDLTARRAEVACLRRAGLTLEQIAARVGVSKRTVITDLDQALTALNEIANEHLETWRSAHLAELQQIRDHAWAHMNDDVSTRQYLSLVNVILRAQEREAKLLGLDAPPARPQPIAAMFNTMTEDEARSMLEMGDI